MSDPLCTRIHVLGSSRKSEYFQCKTQYKNAALLHSSFIVMRSLKSSLGKRYSYINSNYNACVCVCLIKSNMCVYVCICLCVAICCKERVHYAASIQHLTVAHYKSSSFDATLMKCYVTFLMKYLTCTFVFTPVSAYIHHSYGAFPSSLQLPKCTLFPNLHTCSHRNLKYTQFTTDTGRGRYSRHVLHRNFPRGEYFLPDYSPSEAFILFKLLIPKSLSHLNVSLLFFSRCLFMIMD